MKNQFKIGDLVYHPRYQMYGIITSFCEFMTVGDKPNYCNIFWLQADNIVWPIALFEIEKLTE